jgi:hypothetical protein
MHLRSSTGRPSTRRQLTVPVIVAAAAVMVALVAPTSAWAGGPWAVKDADGQSIGTVRTVSASKAKATVQGEAAGEINRTARGKWTAFTLRLGRVDAIHIHHAALWGQSPPWQLRGFAEMGPMPLAGRILKHNGRWVVQAGDRQSGWTTRGSVTGACPPWAAGGAVFLVLVPDF